MSDLTTEQRSRRAVSDGGRSRGGQPVEAEGAGENAGEATDDELEAASLRPARSRSVLWLSGLIIVCLVMGLSFAGAQSFRDLRSARARAAELEQEILDTQAAVESMTRRVHDLRTSSETIERLAREDLGLVRSDEIVIVLPDDHR